MPLATPSTKLPSATLTLTDGSTTIGLTTVDGQGRPSVRGINITPANRTSMKQRTGGGTRNSDYEYPYAPIEQRDWAGGRGLLDLVDDKTRYYDGQNVWTHTSGHVMPATQWSFGKGYRNADFLLPGSVTWQGLFSSNRYVAYKFAASASYSADKAYHWVRRVGTPNGNIVMELCADNSGDPGTVLKTVNVTTSTISDVVSVFQVFDWIGTESLNNTTNYWVKVYAASASDDATNHWEVATNSSSGATEKSSDNSSWSSASYDLYFRVVDADDTCEWRKYEYKRGLYAVKSPDDGSAPQVYINGDRGAADSNSGALTTLVDATKSWTTNEWAGNTCLLVAGPGKGEFRKISSNSSTALTLENAWKETHTTATDYVILGSSKWTEQTSHGLTVKVTDVEVVNNVVYYAQGDGVAMRRHREYNNSGTWTASDWAADSTNKAVRLKAVNDPTNGKQVWRALNSDSGSDVSVSRGPVVDWGTDITFGSAITVGNNDYAITGLHYHDSVLWVYKEDGAYPVYNDIVDELAKEMSEAASLHNGASSAVLSPYIYFSFGYYLNRLQGRTMDTLSLGGEAGFPSGREAVVADLEPVPRYLIMAMDAFETGTSFAMVAEGSRYCEVFRAWEPGQRVRSLNRVVIPGENHKLWIGVGGDLVSMPWSEVHIGNPKLDSDLTFQHEWVLITSWHGTEDAALNKFFHELKVVSENLSSNITIEADYQLDDSSDSSSWTNFASFISSTSQTKDLSSSDSVGGKRVRFRLRGNTNNNQTPPILRATVLETVERIVAKYVYSCRFRLGDNIPDRQGKPDTDPDTAIAQLNTWAAQATPITVNCQIAFMNGKKVFPEPIPLSPDFRQAASDTDRYYGQVLLKDA